MKTRSPQLSILLFGTAADGLVKLESIEADPQLEAPSRMYSDPKAGIKVFALGVPHGPVPALADRIHLGQRNIVFAGDQNGSADGFIDFAGGTDMLAMHPPVPENFGGVGRKLHAPPGLVGKIAAETDAGKLVLSHFKARSLDSTEENLAEIRSQYNGPMISADDLVCIKL